MFNQVIKKITLATLALMLTEALMTPTAYSQPVQQTATPTSTVDGDFNNVFQVPSQNQNINEINIPNIYPLDNPIYTPVNPENDLGFNMSVGVNALDFSNVTVYFGLIYQPGRTDSHRARMEHLNKQTELLEVQRQMAEAQLRKLQQEINQAELQLQRLQESP